MASCILTQLVHGMSTLVRLTPWRSQDRVLCRSRHTRLVRLSLDDLGQATVNPNLPDRVITLESESIHGVHVQTSHRAPLRLRRSVLPQDHSRRQATTQAQALNRRTLVPILARLVLTKIILTHMAQELRRGIA